VNQWSQNHSGGTVIERNLAKTDLPFVELPWIMAAYSDPANHNEEQQAALAIGNDFIAELKSADEWLITTPMYNFAVPARLKAYIDHIVRAGQTFNANPDGSYTGLVTGKKVTVIVASAGEYTPGSPIESYDALRPYLKSILAFIGVTDVTFVQAGSTWKIDRGVTDRETFLASFSDQLASLASV
jgi:FMN-dependent NADH-azoreductase